ncbi:16802_t:CDS:2, partial [Racocetra fulgida]
LGISKCLDDPAAASSVVVGIEAYIDPRCLNPEVKRDKEFDIYSLGVLFWELMNGIPPPSRFTILNKVISQNKEKYIEEISLNKKNNATLSDYADIYIKCCSSELDQRPLLDEISEKLENISKTTVEFIEINNQQKTAQSKPNYSEQLDSPNNTAENISVEKHHEGNQVDFENNLYPKDDKNDGYNHDESNGNNLENKIHPKDDTANYLNEPDSNNEFA